jgi:hypothetical protein
MIHEGCMTWYIKSISKGISKDIEYIYIFIDLEGMLQVCYRYTKNVFKVFSCSARWFTKGILSSIFTDILMVYVCIKGIVKAY